MDTWKITDFYNNDVPAYASYDNLRKIGSYVDGLKISMRKLIYVAFDKLQKEPAKTENFCNVCAAETNYLHGANNLCGVANTLTQKFVGANNYPLLEGFGSFGTRINPTCAAPRYTRIKLSENSKNFFNKEDFEIVEKQIFEGDVIEPKFFIPILPVLLINGSDGLSTGFSQKILPRNPKDIIAYIKAKLEGKKYKKPLMPYYKGFNGSFRYNEEGKLEILGTVKQINATNYVIEELPIFMEYTSYINILDKLVEDKVIIDYVDKCDPKVDNILFEIKTTREFSKKYDTLEALLKVFRLIKPYTEIFNCVDENSRVREFTSVEEIIDAFIDIRLKYYQKRKEHILLTNMETLKRLCSKYLFCAGVIKEEIEIRNMPKQNIIKQLEKINDIVKVDDSYDYILNMPVHSLTKETLSKLKEQISELKSFIKATKSKTIEELWTTDIEDFQE